MVTHTAYTNGTIRNAAGKLVAFYDAASATLLVDGHAAPYPCEDLSAAMDLVGALVK